MNVELLAPAGDMTKLRVALDYGADAVYVAGVDFGLRAASANFTNAELEQAVKLTHERGKKIYVAVNIFARNADFGAGAIVSFVKFLDKIGADAVIVSDIGVMSVVRENTKLPIHISTQANVTNTHAALEYARLGASRIVLARECNIDEIREIAGALRGKCEIECFVHGAMCVSYSGRCLLSNYFSSGGKLRQSNRGECNHPCRWSYNLVEQTRPNTFIPIEQDARGTYILNSRDLCLIDHLDELARAGVTSFKIEGRVKSEYYVACVTNAYRHAIDAHDQNRAIFDARAELEKVAHRPYGTGFLFAPNATSSTEYNESANPTSNYEFIAIVVKNANGDVIEVEERNAINVGDVLEVLSPSTNFNKVFTVSKITNAENVSISRANRPKEILKISCPYKLSVGDMLRKKIVEKDEAQ